MGQELQTSTWNNMFVILKFHINTIQVFDKILSLEQREPKLLLDFLEHHLSQVNFEMYNSGVGTYPTSCHEQILQVYWE